MTSKIQLVPSNSDFPDSVLTVFEESLRDFDGDSRIVIVMTSFTIVLFFHDDLLSSVVS